MFDWGRGFSKEFASSHMSGSSYACDGTDQLRVDEDYELNFQGCGAATSLKAELAARVPELNDAPTYREARRLLVQLGGAEVLKRELVFAGVVDPDTDMLAVRKEPLNVFAAIAAGELVPPGLSEMQVALGDYSSKFLICANRPESDVHWDSQDMKWLPRASMSRRHRLLTTKNLHWQWFNPLTFGLVPPEAGGMTARDAVPIVEEMKSAALHYCKNSEGWSENIGLFVHVFGHNNVNSLFIHVLDMDECGPGFKFHAHKNCPLDDVLKVLLEEAVLNMLPSPPLLVTLLPGLRAKSQTRSFFLPGTDGATSLKEELVARVPEINAASGYREARRLLREDLGGWETLWVELSRAGFVDTESHELTVGVTPFNVFARIAAGKMKQPGGDEEQKFLGEYAEKCVICSNRPENDEHWDSKDPEWVGKASMSRRHKFLILKSLDWQWFNALAFGMVPKSKGGGSLQLAVATIELMKAAAFTYVANRGGWSDKVGLFFHVFGHNTVNSLHMHIVDMSELGPTFWKLEYKNCSIDHVLQVLREEQSDAGPERKEVGEDTNLFDESKMAARNAAEAAASAQDTMIVMESLFSTKGRRSRASDGGPTLKGILQLNIGGEDVDVPRETLLLAPKDSLLGDMFGTGLTSGSFKTDDRGRMFINFPPVSFKHIVNHLRLLHNTNPVDVIQPLEVASYIQDELDQLAAVLGVGEMVFTPQCGKAETMQKRQGVRPRVATVGRRKKGCMGVF